MEKLIAKFDKNVSEEVWVQLREFRGHQLLDVRVHFRPDEGGEPRPTKKGISVSVNLIPRLLDAVQQALKALEEAGIRPKPPSEASEAADQGRAE
jgi:hypothetical protein